MEQNISQKQYFDLGNTNFEDLKVQVKEFYEICGLTDIYKNNTKRLMLKDPDNKNSYVDLILNESQIILEMFNTPIFSKKNCQYQNKKKLEKQLNKFLLNQDEGIVISIQGYWGVGKTHFWNNYIKRTEKASRFVNISLFGINSLDDIKRKILLTTSEIFKFKDNIKKVAGKTKYFGISLSSIVSVVGKDEFKNIIVCFDDFERMSPKLNISEVLGFISELKEQHNCKVILINNNDILGEQDILNHKKILKRDFDNSDINLFSTPKEQQLLNLLSSNVKKSNNGLTKSQKHKEKLIITSTNNEEIFNKYIEKIVDIALWYEPSLEELFIDIKARNLEKNYIDFKLIKKLFAQLTNNNKKFNQRLISQILLKLELFKTILEDEKIHHKIKNGIVLNIFKLVVGEQVDYMPLKIEILTPFDKQIFINVVKKHTIDIVSFKMEVEQQNSYLNSAEYNQTLYDDIQQTYYNYLYSLEYDNDTFVNEFYDLLNTKDIDIVKLVSLNTFNWYIELLQQLDPNNKDNKYQELFIQEVKKYIEKNMSYLINLDSFHKDGIMKIIDQNEQLKAFYESEKEKLLDEKNVDIETIKTILNKILGREGWSHEDEEILATISTSQHKRWLIKDRDYFELIFKLVTYINSFAGDMPFKFMYDNTIQIYRELYSKQAFKNKMEFIMENLKIDRHSYYNELKNNNELIKDKAWLKEALTCTLEKHADWKVSDTSLDEIINSNDYSLNDYLEFISMNNTRIAADLRKLEGKE